MRPVFFLLGFSLIGCTTAGPRPNIQPDPVTADLLPVQAGKVLFVPMPAAVDSAGQPFGGTVLVPLACQREDQLEGGGSCLGLMAKGAKVVLDDGSKSEVGPQVLVSCGGSSADRIRALPLEGATGLVKFAVYPEDALSVMGSLDQQDAQHGMTCRGWCTFGRTGHPRVKIERTLRRQLAAAMAEAGQRQRGEELEVVQRVELDLNGDGTQDQLLSVIVMNEDRQRYAFDFSALYWIDGKTPDVPVLLHRKDTDVVVVRGLLDFEGNGNKHLWLLRSPSEESGITHLILSVQGGRPSIVAQVGCDPAGEDS